MSRLLGVLATIAGVGVMAVVLESRMKADPGLTARVATHADRLALLDVQKIEARIGGGEPEPLYVVQFKDGTRTEFGIDAAAGWIPGATGRPVLRIEAPRFHVKRRATTRISDRDAELILDTMIERAATAAYEKAGRRVIGRNGGDS